MGVHASRLFFRLLDKDVDYSLDIVCEELTEAPKCAGERIRGPRAYAQISALLTLAKELDVDDRDIKSHTQRAENAMRRHQEPWGSIGRALEVTNVLSDELMFTVIDTFVRCSVSSSGLENSKPSGAGRVR